MSNWKNGVGNAVATIYFIVPMTLVLFIMLIMPFGFLMDVSAIRGSGFAGPNSAASLVGLSGLCIGLSLLIPPLRRMYKALPWLYPFTQIFFYNLVILNIGLSILNYGYEISDASRHTTFFWLMVAQIVLCRLGMCIYYKFRPAKAYEGR